MDDELLRYLQGMEGRLQQGLKQDMTEMEARLIERMRDMQTELLKAYLPAQQQSQIRDNLLEARGAAVESRVAIVEGRLLEIEKRLMMNPPAA